MEKPEFERVIREIESGLLCLPQVRDGGTFDVEGWKGGEDQRGPEAIGPER
jgi:hypothetical protein